jgi:ketosteroid isomerase-like protein
MTQTHDIAARRLVERWIAAINAHDADAAASCFHPDHRQEAPARRGVSVHGRDEVRRNHEQVFAEIPDIRAELLGTAVEGDTVWVEFRLEGLRNDGTLMEFIGVNLFGVEQEQFAWARVYSELVRDGGDIEAELERMTGGKG